MPLFASLKTNPERLKELVCDETVWRNDLYSMIKELYFSSQLLGG